MNLPASSFICARWEYNTKERFIPQPLFRRTFDVRKGVVSAHLTIGSLGYYEVHINGENITKGEMAPYRSNPDNYVYFDRYETTGLLKEGKNTIGVILGNGIQNSITETWEFTELPWRSAPAVSFELTVCYEDGSTDTVLSDENTLVSDSPIIFNDFHFGEYYDARLEQDGWDTADFDDSAWKNAIKIKSPRGEARLCEVEPIVIRNELKAVSITEYDGGYIYDFGENNAGLCRLKINGKSGQKILTVYFETLMDGKPYTTNIRFDAHPDERYQEDEYICRGNKTEVHVPRFTYHGFRYVYVTGVAPEQATEELLTYLLISSDIKRIGDFSCSDNVVNRLQDMTLRSDISNFHYFPTDCPQREKNGWTADASLSAEQLLLNYTPEKSYSEWLLNIYKAMKPNGQLPGIIPTGTWGYDWGNGPAWDNVIVYLPYYIYMYRGDKKVLEQLSVPLMRYLTYVYSRLDENDLIEIGLGDWCQPGRNSGNYETPLVVTDSILTVDIARKASFFYDVLALPAQKQYADALAARVTNAIRTHLIDHESLTVKGDTQSAQAMAIYYGMFTEKEKAGALEHLLELIDKDDGHLNVGVLGGRVIFRLLAENGYADLAYNMITRPDYPSYGDWVQRGATTLFEDFRPEGARLNSLNHHFWGDISAWFYRYLGGIRFNPTAKDVQTLDISPCFVSKLEFAKASHCAPDGEIQSEWMRKGKNIELKISVPKVMKGSIILPDGYAFDDGETQKPLASGIYTVIPT